jgi:hypothetical protein
MAGEVEGILFESGDGSGSCRVLPSSLVEVAELIGCEPTDLTSLRFGENGVVWMSKSRQLERETPPNRNAAVVLMKIHQLPVPLRGVVVFFPHGAKFEVN